MKSVPPAAFAISPMEARIRQVLPARVARITHFSHMTCSISGLARTSNFAPLRTVSIAWMRSDRVPSNSPKEME